MFKWTNKICFRLKCTVKYSESKFFFSLSVFFFLMRDESENETAFSKTHYNSRLQAYIDSCYVRLQARCIRKITIDLQFIMMFIKRNEKKQFSKRRFEGYTQRPCRSKIVAAANAWSIRCPFQYTLEHVSSKRGNMFPDFPLISRQQFRIRNSDSWDVPPWVAAQMFRAKSLHYTTFSSKATRSSVQWKE